MGLSRKKKPKRSSQAGTERVQKLRAEYWEKVKDIDPENLVFIDETGVVIGLTRTHARSNKGTRIYDRDAILSRSKSYSNWCNKYERSSSINDNK